jgi:hypothetical protein
MSDYDPTAYGAALADVYDELYGADVLDTEGAVRRLRRLAGSGPVLELGWNATPFTAASQSHVSVYRKPTAST